MNSKRGNPGIGILECVGGNGMEEVEMDAEVEEDTLLVAEAMLLPWLSLKRCCWCSCSGTPFTGDEWREFDGDKEGDEEGDDDGDG